MAGGVTVGNRLLKPSLTDCFFLALIAWLFLFPPDGWSRLLDDGDAGWHIRTGQWILEHRTVPRTDLFSFSKPGEPWFAWEWGADVLFATVHALGGLKGVVLLSGLLIAAFGAVLFRYTVWRGANGLIAVAVVMLAVGASSLHYLARPHLFTLVLVPVFVWIAEADRRSPSWRVWTLVPLMAVWTNLHGGFLAGIAILGLVAAGTGLEAVWRGPEETGQRDFAPPLRYLALTAACFAATFVNPYGWQLHAHIAEYLRSDWIKEAVDEFQSPSFRSENILQYEALLLAGLLAAGGQLTRRRAVEPLLLIFWAHQSLASVRHVTIYCALAAPLVAAEASWYWDRWAASAPRKSVGRILHAMGTDLRAASAHLSLWPAAAVFALAALNAPLRWPRDFPESRFPAAAVSRNAEAILQSRLLTTDQWADYVIFRLWPRVRVFVDGRSDFYGRKLGQEYVRLSQAGSGWQALMERHRFSAALVPTDWPLSEVLKRDPQWRLVDSSKKALFFQKVEVAVPVAAGISAPDRGKIRGED
jgi:hypothetical protein